MEKRTNILRWLTDAFHDGLEIEVDEGSGWEPWLGTHYNTAWGFRIQYPSGGWKEVQRKE